MIVDLNDEAGLSLLKSRLRSLDNGESFEGVKQRDGNNFAYLRGWAFRRSATTALPGQHIFVFHNGFVERAVLWVDPGGQPLAVPPSVNPSADSESVENAIDLVGERFMPPFFKDDGRIYICRHMNPTW